MDVILREAQEIDYDSINTLYTEELSFHIALEPDMFQMFDPVMTVDWYKKQLDNKAVVLFVAEVDESVVGVIQVMLHQSPNDPIFKKRTYVHIEDIVVGKQFQGKGVGRSLMEAAERWAKDKGASAIELWVWRANEDAIGFYNNLGYKTNRLSMKLTLN